MLALMLTLAAMAPATDLLPLDGPARVTPGAVVRLSLNGDADYRPGDRVRVEVDVAEDGYLVVFRVDGDGFIRVLFPLDPDLDPFVRGGRRYELRGRGARETFLADDRGGTGLVYAALSREPLDLARYATGMHWDYSRLRLEGDDAEAELTWFVRQMSANGRFEYDVLGYRVYGPGFEEAQPVIVAGGGSGWYDPYLDCLACGWRAPGTSIRIGIGGGGWYDPWYDPWFDPWVSPWGFRTWRTGWGGFWGWDPYWGTPWRPITVINPYPRPTIPNTVYGVRSRPNVPVGSTFGPGGPPSGAVRPQPRPGFGNADRESGGGASAPVRPRAPQGESTRARTAGERGSAGAPPASSRPTSPPAERSRRPVDQAAGAPAAAERPVSRPEATRPVVRVPESRPVDRGESSRPVIRPSDDRPVVRPDADRMEPRVRVPESRPVERSRDDRPVVRTPDARPVSRADDRPVYRPPTPQARPVETPRREERPVSSPPRQVERPAPRRESSPPPRQSSPPPRVERPSTPAARSAPPPSRPASPPPSSSRPRRPNN